LHGARPSSSPGPRSTGRRHGTPSSAGLLVERRELLVLLDAPATQAHLDDLAAERVEVIGEELHALGREEVLDDRRARVVGLVAHARLVLREQQRGAHLLAVELDLAGREPEEREPGRHELLAPDAPPAAAREVLAGQPLGREADLVRADV